MRAEIMASAIINSILPNPHHGQCDESGSGVACTEPTDRVLHEDEILVIRCLRNEGQAWTTLFEMCHSRIVARLCSLFGRSPTALEKANDVAAQVWLSVLAYEGRLLRRFDARAGARLTTYLNSIAVKIGLSHLRESRRRLRRESEYAAEFVKRIEVPQTSLIEIEEFVGQLSPREATFYREHLLAADESFSTLTVSEQNSWQLRHRVRKKLLGFLAMES